MDLDRTAVYRLLDVQDHEGRSRVESRKLYRDRVGCLATDLRWDGSSLRMRFVRDQAGNPIDRPLCTSVVLDLSQRDGQLVARTLNSVYLLQRVEGGLPAEPAPVFPGETPEEMVELYLSEEGDHFCRGIYWDAAGGYHSLMRILHPGMVIDTCLVALAGDDGPGRFLCSYYLGQPDCIRFYGTPYGQQKRPVPLLVHNCGSIPLRLCREGDGQEQTVEPGGQALLRQG